MHNVVWALFKYPPALPFFSSLNSNTHIVAWKLLGRSLIYSCFNIPFDNLLIKYVKGLYELNQMETKGGGGKVPSNP